MLHWVQYIRGYVKIKVWGYSTERLLNLCGNHDILVWDIVNHGDHDTMKISVRGFFALKPLLKKTGTRAAVLQKYGLPFFMSKMQKRKVFVAGLLGCPLFWVIMAGYIWNIEIEGNYVLTEDVLMDYLDEKGVHVAMKKSRLQIEGLEKALREDHDIITWTSVQVKGTTLLIHIKENEMPDYEQNMQQAQEDGIDLIATRSGTVTTRLPESASIRRLARRTTAMPELSINVSPPRSSRVFTGRFCSMHRSMASISPLAAWWSSSPVRVMVSCRFSALYFISIACLLRAQKNDCKQLKPLLAVIISRFAVVFLSKTGGD